MGLKTTNYYVNSIKETLPQAYAVVREFAIGENDMGIATIGIHKTRELAIDPDVIPYETIQITFKSLRNAHDRETIYKIITQPKTVRKLDYKTKTIVETIEYPIFYGWDNDINTIDKE